jgi:hypothetical protein
MWKSLLDALLMACIAMDPAAYMYWRIDQLDPDRFEPAEGGPRCEEKVVSLERRWETSL